MPGAFEGETVTRRRFMDLTRQRRRGWSRRPRSRSRPSASRSAPVFSRVPFNWQPIGAPSDFTERHLRHEGDHDRPGDRRGRQVDRLRPGAQPRDRHRAGGPVQPVVALSSRCMHLGCPVRYVAAAERFICPCHGGVYDFRGHGRGRPAGAPARPLLHAAELERPASRSVRATRSTPSCSASRRVTRASRSTASASTCTRRVSRPPPVPNG